MIRSFFATLFAIVGFCSLASAQNADTTITATTVTNITVDSMAKILKQAPRLQQGKKRIYNFDIAATTVSVEGKKIVAVYTESGVPTLQYQLTLEQGDGGFSGSLKYTMNGEPLGIPFMSAKYTAATPDYVEIGQGGKIWLK